MSGEVLAETALQPVGAACEMDYFFFPSVTKVLKREDSLVA